MHKTYTTEFTLRDGRGCGQHSGREGREEREELHRVGRERGTTVTAAEEREECRRSKADSSQRRNGGDHGFI